MKSAMGDIFLRFDSCMPQTDVSTREPSSVSSASGSGSEAMSTRPSGPYSSDGRASSAQPVRSASLSSGGFNAPRHVLASPGVGSNSDSLHTLHRIGGIQGANFACSPASPERPEPDFEIGINTRANSQHVSPEHNRPDDGQQEYVSCLHQATAYADVASF